MAPLAVPGILGSETVNLCWQFRKMKPPWYYTRLIITTRLIRILSSYAQCITTLLSRHQSSWRDISPKLQLCQNRLHTWTTASVIAGLNAAHNLARLMGHPESAKRFLNRSLSLTKALRKHLWNEEEQCFYKFLKVNDEGEIIERNSTIDSSTLGVYLLGVLPADDEMVVKNNQKVREKLWVPNEIGGLARYQGDWYQRTEGGSEIPGNPWIITTLWYAMWLTDHAKTPEDLKEASSLINWVTDKATPTGVLPEQIHFRTGNHVSVSPLTWSHATFVEAVLKYSHKLEEFGFCEIPKSRN